MPLDESDKGRIRDAMDFGQEAIAMADGLTVEDIQDDRKTLFALCYAIQVVGEAVWKISEEIKNRESTIPWPLIASMRHRLVHDYGRTDETIVLDVAQNHLPELLAQLQVILDAK